MEEKHRMHGLAQRGISTKRERKIAQPSAYLGTGQIAFNPSHGANEIQSVTVMFFKPCGYGKDVWIEYYIFGRKRSLLGEKPVSAGAHLRLTLIYISLPLFVKGHHHHGGTLAADDACTTQKLLFPVFQRDGIYYALTLHTSESLLYDLPFGRIDHHRHTGNIRLGGKQS